tara:strand:- start:301 stop:597 length:297 start_codon:yes stop_codon:yes gene_type:complete
MRIETYKNQLSEWEFDKLVNCHSSLAETMLLQRVQVFDSTHPMKPNLEESLLDNIGINARGFYFINRGYCCFTAYFEHPADQHDFANLVNKYSQKIST